MANTRQSSLAQRLREAKRHPDRWLLPIEQRTLLDSGARVTASDLKLIEGWYRYLEDDANRARMRLLGKIERHSQFTSLSESIRRKVQDRQLPHTAANHVRKSLDRRGIATLDPASPALQRLVAKYGPQPRRKHAGPKPARVPVMDEAMSGGPATLTNVTPEERRGIMATAGNAPGPVRVERGETVPGTKKRKKRK